MNGDTRQANRMLVKEYYREVAKWLERVALLVLASLVVQKIVLGEINNPLVYVGLSVSLVMYFCAYKLLIRS